MASATRRGSPGSRRGGAAAVSVRQKLPPRVRAPPFSRAEAEPGDACAAAAVRPPVSIMVLLLMQQRQPVLVEPRARAAREAPRP
jgi:hypothetical protein